MAKELQLHQPGVDHDGVLKGLDDDFPRPMGATPNDSRFALTSSGRDALGADSDFADAPVCTCEETGRDDCALHGPNSAAALDAAIAGNASMFDTLNQEVGNKAALVRELQAQVTEYRRMALGCQQERDNVIANHGALIEKNVRLETRLARLTEHGTPAPASLDDALEQLFDAEAVYDGAEEWARNARSMKFDAQIARDVEEAAAIVRLVGTGGVRGQLPVPGAMSPTEAKDRLEEDAEYRELAELYRNDARESDAAETKLRIAASRVATLRECVHAMSHRSPLTARAARIVAAREQ